MLPLRRSQKRKKRKTMSDTGDSFAGTTEGEWSAPVHSEPAMSPQTRSVPSGTGQPKPVTSRPNRRKVREGVVTSDKMDKTVVVSVVERVRHPRYVKTVQRTKKLYAHDESNDLRPGDRVRLAETRPLSRLKRWRVVEVLERAR
jgi:small subunit ribosomal protein S17